MKFLILFFIIIPTLTGCDNTSQINFNTTKGPVSQNIYGTYSTNITDKTAERLNNINLGVQKLDGVSIAPNIEFSFNDTIGPRTKELGYKEAIIFAFLGVLRISGINNCLSSVTGANTDNCGGNISGIFC